MVDTYLIRDWYLGANDYAYIYRSSTALGTDANPFAINNWRQMKLLYLMPWFTYTLSSDDIYVPYSVNDMPFAVHKIITDLPYGLYEGDDYDSYKFTIRSAKNLTGSRRDILILCKNVESGE